MEQLQLPSLQIRVELEVMTKKENSTLPQISWAGALASDAVSCHSKDTPFGGASLTTQQGDAVNLI